jgi:hypothetical protein
LVKLPICLFRWGTGGSDRFRRALIAESEDENQADARANGAVSDVKGRKADFAAAAGLDVKVEKINDVAHPNAVDEIADDAATDEAESSLAKDGASIEMMAADEQDDQGDYGHDRKPGVISAEEAPGGASVAPMDEFEKAIHNDFFPERGGISERPENDLFGELVDKDNQDRDKADSSIGGSPKEVHGAHSSKIGAYLSE